jgi:ACS family D-galactonate transporter-like MFS transporter
MGLDHPDRHRRIGVLRAARGQHRHDARRPRLRAGRSSRAGPEASASENAAAKVDAATQAALAAHPPDQAAQVKALSEISGLPAADVGTAAILFAQHAPAFAAGQAVDPTTQIALLTNPNDQVAAAKAVQEVVAKLGIAPAGALARLQDLRSIPVAQLLLVQQDGTKVQDAGAQRTALAKVPPADLLFLKQYGTALQDLDRGRR